MNIGEVIVGLRKQWKLKQKDLAKELEISATYLSMVEKNKQTPSVELIAKIAKFFDLPVSAIFLKALEHNNISNKEQKQIQKYAKPVVDSLIDFLLSDRRSPRRPELLVQSSRRP